MNETGPVDYTSKYAPAGNAPSTEAAAAAFAAARTASPISPTLHTLRTLFLCSALPAFLFSLPLLFIGFHTATVNYIVGSALLLLGGALGGFFAAHFALPAGFRQRYIPAALPLLLALVFLAGIALTLGMQSSFTLLFILPYGLLEIPFIPALAYATITGQTVFTAIFPLLFHTAFLLVFFLRERRRPDKSPMPCLLVPAVITASAVLITAISVPYYMSRRNLLPPDYGTEYGGGYSSVDLNSYDVTNPQNRLPRLSAPASFTVSNPSAMPVLDGAEAAFPVYSAFALACYEDISALETQAKNAKNITVDQSGGNAVTFTNTIYAYERLLSGEVDIFFGAQPSAEQRKMAEDAGKQLVLTPIGLEAFVFFVSEENPVQGLTSDEIRTIYIGRIVNWQAVGGPDERILAFQRPENSGSQTIMEQFMGGSPLQKPLEEEYSSMMGGVTRQVADYRNYPGALGYSFRFFLTGMAEQTGVRMLAVDGASPTSQNIAAYTYPLTVMLYAVTLEDNQNENVAPFLQWMQSPEGQELVERIGYVPLS